MKPLRLSFESLLPHFVRQFLLLGEILNYMQQVKQTQLSVLPVAFCNFGRALLQQRHETANGFLAALLIISSCSLLSPVHCYIMFYQADFSTEIEHQLRRNLASNEEPSKTWPYKTMPNEAKIGLAPIFERNDLMTSACLRTPDGTWTH